MAGRHSSVFLRILFLPTICLFLHSFDLWASNWPFPLPFWVSFLHFSPALASFRRYSSDIFLKIFKFLVGSILILFTCTVRSSLPWSLPLRSWLASLPIMLFLLRRISSMWILRWLSLLWLKLISLQPMFFAFQLTMLLLLLLLPLPFLTSIFLRHLSFSNLSSLPLGSAISQISLSKVLLGFSTSLFLSSLSSLSIKILPLFRSLILKVLPLIKVGIGVLSSRLLVTLPVRSFLSFSVLMGSLNNCQILHLPI